MTQNRDFSLDIAKAICIVLMVIGHSGCTTYLHDFVYMFHMPCFFFVSGWLLSDRYLTDVCTGLKRKLKGSYWPFVKWQFIFLFLHNAFVQMHFYAEAYSLRDFAEQLLRTVIMAGGESLLGGYWFLISLTWASVATLLLLYVLKKRDSLTVLSISGGVILILLTCSLWCLIPFKLPSQFGEQTIMATAFYMSGCLFRRVGLHPKHIGVWGLCLYVLPAVAAVFTQFNMVTEKGMMIFPLYVVAMFGTVATLFCSQALAKTSIAPLLSYIGSKTLYILTFHFLAFKPITYILIRINDMPITYMSQFPVLEEASGWMWIVYSISGVCLSLLTWNLFHLPCWQLLRMKKK